MYVYTLSNITADHTIVVTAPVVGQDEFYFRANGSWVKAAAIYKKINGSWVEQTNLSNIF